MFEIKIAATTPQELVLALREAADAMNGTTTAPKARKAKAEPTPQEQVAETLNQPNPIIEAMDRFVPDAADDPTPEPMPESAKAVVDAGTGRPVEPVKQMTFDDVKAAAAKLAAKDTPALKSILSKYSAAKLSDVPKESLGDFASDVLAALD